MQPHPMMNPQEFSIEWGGRTLTIQTGKLAQLANASVVVRYGDTVILSTIGMSRSVRAGIDYFPLMVDFEENMGAAGKIKGSRFMKREGRPTDVAILNARIADRSLRPLFDYNIRNDIQVVISVKAFDGDCDPSYVGLIAASAVTAISDIPAEGPIAGLAVGYVDGQYVLNPTPEQRVKSTLYVLGAVRADKIVMLESEAKQAPEDVVMGAFEFLVEQAQPVIELIKKVQAAVGKEKIQPALAEKTDEEKTMYSGVEEKVTAHCNATLGSLFGIKGKKERTEKEEAFKAELFGQFETDEEKAVAADVFEHCYEAEFRKQILESGVRVDGRQTDELRDLYAEIDLLPRVHGSALFQRGETQVLSTVTLAPPAEALIVDGLEPEYEKRYIHHYNFPPYSVGEVKPMRGPSRRDIGHGALAEKALEGVIPSKEEFPYMIRVVSDTLMSNGSSSQASACGSSLALMAAGVPIKNPVAGIAMGLVMTDDASEYKVLTDIQGIEDHSGDMDFKIAGTTEGVTAVQLDIKLFGISLDICRDTLAAARKARLEILEVMKQAIAEPRMELSPYAPRVEVLQIDPEKIGAVIGSGGKTINMIIEKTGAKIDIEDDGLVYIATSDGEAMERAKKLIIALTKDIEVGEIYEGIVEKIVSDKNSGSEIGAIVSLGLDRDGMVHISNVCHCRINKVTDVLNVGDRLQVQVVEIDKERGRIGLSRKALIDKNTPDAKCDLAGEKAGHKDFTRGDRF